MRSLKRFFTICSLCLAGLLFNAPVIYAGTVTIKGKVTQLNGNMPATAILHSTADESYTGTANIDKEGNFSFTADVPKATLFNVRVMRMSYDILVSAAEKTVTLSTAFDGEILKDVKTENSPENDAYKTLKALLMLYDTKVTNHFRFCEDDDSCNAQLHETLAEFTHQLELIQKNYKHTYTAEVLCKMKTPYVAKEIKNTTAGYRDKFFDNVDFSDSTIFSTPIFRDMLSLYVNFVVEPSISKENKFMAYFTDKIKANQLVYRKSANALFDELVRGQKEKMLTMYINWYYSGDNKKQISNPVLDIRLGNISRVMPGQPYIDVSAPDTGGIVHALKEVVEKSKCTMLLFWSSECPHCRDEMPFIKDYYEKYHTKGLGIFAISLDPDPNKWKNFVADKQLPWTNVVSSYSANPNPAMLYVSVSTPTMILIDSKGNIIHRFIPKSRLEKHIIEALK